MKRAFLASSHKLGGIFIMNGEGEICWTHPALNPQDLWMLEDGSIAFAWKNGIKRIRTKDDFSLFDYIREAPDQVPSLQLLPGGRLLVGVVGKCELLEMDWSGRIFHRLQLSTSASGIHSQFRFCRKTSEGMYLVPFTAEGAVRKYDADGRIVIELRGLDSPVCALETPERNLLVSMRGSVRIYDSSQREIWRFSGADVPSADFAIAAGLHLLRNGNILFTNWGSSAHDGKQAVHIFETTPGKEIVWQCSSPLIGNIGQCRLLNPDLTASAESVLS